MVERLHGEMYSEIIGEGLVSSPSGSKPAGGQIYSYISDRNPKNHFGGIVERTLILDHKVGVLDMVSERMVEQHTQWLPCMGFGLQENQKTNPRSSIEEGGWNFFKLFHSKQNRKTTAEDQRGVV